MRINKRFIDEGEYSDEFLNNLAIQYFAITSDFKSGKLPPTPTAYIQEFEKRYKIEINLDEFFEIKEYSNNDYKYYLPDSIEEANKDFERIDTTNI